MRSRHAAIAALHAGFVVTGIVTTLLGPILPELTSRWSLSDAGAGAFFTLQFFGSLAGIGSLGVLLSKRGYQFTFFLGFMCLSLGLTLLLPINKPVAMISTSVFGYGLGLILSAGNLWIAEVESVHRASAVSILNVAWGIGAISCPALVLMAQGKNRLAALMWVAAGLSACVALILGATGSEPCGMSSSGSDTSFKPGRRQLSTALGGLFFLYVGTETCVGGWTAALAKRVVATNGSLWTLVPMFFWAGLLAGRALTPVILVQLKEGTLLMSGLALAAIATSLLLWVSTFGGAAICITAAGLGLASVYPLLISRLVGYYGSEARTRGSRMFAFASLGGATMPWLVGFTSVATASLRTGLLIPLFGCIVMMALLSSQTAWADYQ
jgi:fucose permease